MSSDSDPQEEEMLQLSEKKIIYWMQCCAMPRNAMRTMRGHAAESRCCVPLFSVLGIGKQSFKKQEFYETISQGGVNRISSLI